MYPIHVIVTLIGMITAGAGRIVAVKVYFQMQEEESRPETPMFVTLLYLVGQALSLVVHCIYTRLQRIKKIEDENNNRYAKIEMVDRCTADDPENISRLPDASEDKKI